MARKFISFLGTADYAEVFYELNGEKSNKKIKFVQEAIITLACKQFDIRTDKIIILLTEAAREKNWEKLKNSLVNSGIPEEMILSLDIPAEKGEAGVWRLFEKIYNDVIEHEDTVIFDITNAFRFLPVVMYSVLRYAQYLKNVKLEGIYYGAYEQTENEVEPIINLTETYEIIEWAAAANIFTSYGISSELNKRIKKQNEDFSKTGHLSDAIVTMSRNINFARGLRIMEGNIFQNCIEKIDIYKEDKSINPALPPILDKVTKKIEKFKTNSVLNFIPALEWYIEHDMPAEALSMMKEGIVSYLLVENNLNYKDSLLRLVFGQRLSYKGTSSFDYKKTKIESKKEIIEEIMNQENTKELKSIIESFNSFRNDIDHCGFGEGARNPENLQKELKKAFEKIKTFFSEKIE